MFIYGIKSTWGNEMPLGRPLLLHDFKNKHFNN